MTFIYYKIYIFRDSAQHEQRVIGVFHPGISGPSKCLKVRHYLDPSEHVQINLTVSGVYSSHFNMTPSVRPIWIQFLVDCSEAEKSDRKVFLEIYEVSKRCTGKLAEKDIKELRRFKKVFNISFFI